MKQVCKSEGRTLLHHACALRKSKIVQLLLLHSADHSAADKRGTSLTPLLQPPSTATCSLLCTAIEYCAQLLPNLCVMQTVCCVLSRLCRLCAMYYADCVLCAIQTVCCVLCIMTMYYALYIMHDTLSTVYYVLCIMHYVVYYISNMMSCVI